MTKTEAFHTVPALPGAYSAHLWVVEIDTVEGPVSFGTFASQDLACAWAYHFEGAPKVIELTLPTFNRG